MTNFCSPLAENMFGKMRGRFCEESARAACEEIIKRIVWGFAALSSEDKARAVDRFNAMHGHPDKPVKHRIVISDQ